MARRTRARGHIEERPNGKFRAVVYAGKDPFTGRDRYLREQADNEKLAQKVLTRLLSQVDEQRQPRSAITVRQAIDKWFDVVDHELSTRRRQEQLLRAYIDPRFGSMQLGRLGPEQLEQFYAQLQRCREQCDGRRKDHECRGLANSTIRQIHFMLRASSERAVRWQYVSVNAAALADPPSFKRPDPDPPSPEEVAAVLNDAWLNPAWGMLLWLVMITGARRGELCVLRWTDIDLDRGTIVIERSSEETRDRTIREKGTKSGQKRRIGLDEYTVELLREYRAHCVEQCESLDMELVRSAFLFSTVVDFSRPIRPDTVTARYRRLATRNQLRSTRLHSLRHYSATELLTAGVDLRTVAGRLGHGSGGGTTLRVYSAWVEKADRSAATVLANAIPRPNPARRTPRSPYEQLAAEMREAITTGVYQPGAILPTTSELAASHNLSAGTVNRAIGILKADGLIEVSRGKRAMVLGFDAPPRS